MSADIFFRDFGAVAVPFQYPVFLNHRHHSMIIVCLYDSTPFRIADMKYLRNPSFGIEIVPTIGNFLINAVFKCRKCEMCFCQPSFSAKNKD